MATSKMIGPSKPRMLLARRPGDPRRSGVRPGFGGQVDGAEQRRGRDIPDCRASEVSAVTKIPEAGPGACRFLRPVRPFFGGKDGAVGRVDEQDPAVDLADHDRARCRPQCGRAGIELIGNEGADATPPVMSNRTTPPSLPRVARFYRQPTNPRPLPARRAPRAAPGVRSRRCARSAHSHNLPRRSGSRPVRTPARAGRGMHQ